MGRVLEVRDPSHVKVDRGSMDGLTAVATNLPIHPVRKIPGQSKANLDNSYWLAVGRVVSLGDHTATLELSHITEPVNPGDCFFYFLDVSPALREDTLFNVAARDTQFRKLGAQDPIYTLGDILADPSQEFHARIVGQFLDEVHSHAAHAGEVYKNRIEGGSFHGKTLREAFEQTTREQILAFLDYVWVYPASYATRTFNFVEEYAGWIARQTPSATGQLSKMKAHPLLAGGEEKTKHGDLDAAELDYRKALKLVTDPDDIKEINQKLETLNAIRIRAQALAKDPDDTAKRYQQMSAFYQLGLYDRALAELDPLEKAGYNPDTCKFYRGYIAVSEHHYPEALAIFRSLLKGDENEDKETTNWIEYAETMQKLDAAPGSFAALKALGDLALRGGSGELAVKKYSEALDSAKTPEEAAAGRSERDRALRLRDADNLTAVAKSKIRRHELREARELIAQMSELAVKAGQTSFLSERLYDIARVASGVSETDLALEVARERVTRDPKNARAHVDLAIALLRDDTTPDDLRSAMSEVEAALAVDASSKEALYLRARLRLLQNDFDGARSDADAVARDKKTFAPARRVLAQVAAAQGHYQEAVEEAQQAHALDPSDGATVHVLNGARRAALAAQELATGKNDAHYRFLLTKSLIDLELPGVVRAQLQTLGGTPEFREANWSYSMMDWISLSERLAAARAASAETPARKRRLRVLELESALRQNPSDPERRVELAKALLGIGRFHAALATLGDLLEKPGVIAAADVAELAREGLAANDEVAAAGEAEELEEWAKAEALYGHAREVFVKTGSVRDAISAGSDLADVLSTEGKSKPALDHMQRAVADSEADGDPLGLFATLFKVAAIQREVGDLDAMAKALAYGQQVCEGLGYEYGQAVVHRQLASIHAAAGHYAKALAEANEAYRLAVLSGDDSMLESTLAALVRLKLATDDLAGAQAAADQLLAARGPAGAAGDAPTLMLLGQVSVRRGDLRRARSFYAEAYQLGTRVGSTATRANALFADAEALLTLGRDPRLAAAQYRKAVELFRSVNQQHREAQSLLGLGRALAQLSPRDEEALERLAQARDLFANLKRVPEVGRAQSEIALVESKLGRSEAALADARNAVQIANQSEDRHDQWMADHALGHALEKAGQFAQAAVEYETAAKGLAEAMQLVEPGEREGWLIYGRGDEVFEDAITLLSNQGLTERLAIMLQLMRGIKLQQIFGQIRGHDALTEQALEELRSAQAEAGACSKNLCEVLARPEGKRDTAHVGALTEDVERSIGKMKQALVDLKTKYPELYGFLSIRSEGVDEVMNLPPDVLVVEYFYARDTLHVLLMRRDTPWREIPVPVSTAEMDDKTAAFSRALRLQRYEATELAKWLYDRLLLPIEDDLQKAHTILIVPFGSLHYVPFGALAKTDQAGRLWYAVEKYRIGYLSANTLYQMAQPRRSASARLLGFADPDDTLPDAKKELRAIADEVPIEAKILYGKDATRASFFGFAENYSILHFATHGFVSPEAGQSYLALADGKLTMQEIAGFSKLRGRSDLVVLSACDTATQKERSPGDELNSIAYAFTAAGAKAVIATLWPVDDEATRRLMTELYRSLHSAAKTDTLDALRKAQLGLLRREEDGDHPFAAPYYWAAFELIGDYR